MEWPQSATVDASPASKFLAIWQSQAKPPDVFAYLKALPQLPISDQFDIVRVDQKCRWEAGLAIPVERYFKQLSFLEEDVEKKFALVYAELRYLRRCWLRDNIEPEAPAAPAPKPAEPEEEWAVDAMDTASSMETPSDPKTHFRLFFQSFLPQCQPFANLPAVVVDLLASYMRRVTCGVGFVLLEQGDPGEHLLILLEGSVEIFTTDAQGQRRILGQAHAPTILGEMALLTREPRSATVVATSPIEAGILPVSEFRRLRREYPVLAEVLTSLLAERLAQNPSQQTIGNYRVLRRLGAGGLGTVYHGARLDGTPMALKIVNHRLVHTPKAADRILKCADVAKQLTHPQIARLYEVFPAFETIVLASEFCDGATVEQLLDRHGALPESQVCRILGYVANALAYAHRYGVAHRNLKPSNVMVSRTGNVVVTDFALAIPPAEAQSAEQALAANYLAPEQHAVGDGDEKSDLYAFGCLAYEMLTARPPFPQPDSWTLYSAKLNFRLPTPDEIGASSEIYQLMTQTLQSRPEGRILNLDEIATWAGPVDTRFFADTLG